MARLAKDVMTSAPVCCGSQATLDEVARLMVDNDCGEIPVVDDKEQPIGVITDRDIVCRVVAEGKNPTSFTVEQYMSRPAVTVRADMPIDAVVATMEEHQIRRVPVVDDRGCCTGIIAQADIATTGEQRQVAEFVREVSR